MCQNLGGGKIFKSNKLNLPSHRCNIGLDAALLDVTLACGVVGF